MPGQWAVVFGGRPDGAGNPCSLAIMRIGAVRGTVNDLAVRTQLKEVADALSK